VQPILSPTTCSQYSYYACSGNTLEFCGAPSLLQVWSDTNYTGPTVKPAPTRGNTTATLPSGTRATYAACYTEAAGVRALPGYTFTNTTGMTVELCGAACSSRSYLYFGLEYSSQCYCGNAITTAILDESECSFPCVGDQTEFCGAGAILSVWSLGGAINLPGTATTTASAAPLTTIVPNSQYIGCYSETNPRALGTVYGFSNTSVSNTLCAVYAQQLNLQYFYTEYFSQCYAGNTLNSASVLIDASKCNDACQGNSLQICGGSNAISLWSNNLYVPRQNPSPVNVTGSTAQYAYVNCYTEGTNNQRALSGNSQYQATTAPASVINPSSLTVEACAAYCGGGGYRYFGVENGQECYCNGAGPINGAVLGTGCTTTCAGSPYEYCGGAAFLNVYKLVGS
jgi:WSC domain